MYVFKVPKIAYCSSEHACGSPRSSFLMSFPTKRNKGFSEKWMTPGLEQENEYKISLEYLLISERKELLKKKNDRGISLMGLPLAKFRTV